MGRRESQGETVEGGVTVVGEGCGRSLGEAEEGRRRNGGVGDCRSRGLGLRGPGATATELPFSPRVPGGSQQSLSSKYKPARAAGRPPPSPTHLNAVVGDHSSDELVETGGPDGHKRSLHRAGSRFGIPGADVT